jgi:type IV pilus assembly protein PilM
VKYFNFKEKKVVCSLPGRSVVIRQVTLPSGLSDKELKVAAIGEVERFLPFPLDEMEFDYEVLGEVQQGDVKQSSVLFVAAHREAVQRRVEAAHFAGLDSVEVDVDPFVILRSMVESGLFEDQDTFTQTFLLIEMGASSTSVSIVKNGVLRFTRIFAVGGDMLTHAVESGLAMNYLDAEKLKKTKAVAFVDEELGAVDSESRELHEMIRPHLEALSLEVRRSLAYYTSKYRGEGVTKILLTGGGSLLKGISRFFEEDLGIPVAYGNPMSNIYYIGNREAAEVSKTIPFLGIALGLSLRQISNKTIGRYCLRVVIEPTYEFGSTMQAGSLSTT